MNKWIIALLIFSLAVNVAVVGTLVYYWTQTKGAQTARFSPPPLPERPRFKRGPNLSPEQRQKIRQLRQEYFATVREIRRTIGTYHEELMDMLASDSFSRDSLQVVVEKIARKQMELEQLTVAHLLDLRKNMDREQWQQFVKRLRREKSFFLDKRRPGRKINRDNMKPLYLNKGGK